MPALLFPASPSLFVDSLDSKLWYRSGCRAAALASSSTLAVGQSFSSFSLRGARSKDDQQPDGRVAHNQKLQNILGVDIGILATQVLRARKTRKWTYIKRDLGVRRQILLGNMRRVKYHRDMVLVDLMRLVCGLASLLYITARTFLVVECFLSLFHSPPGVFRQPVWSVYFPHLR